MKLNFPLINCLCLTAVLAGCGGTGFPPQVTAVKAQALQYGRTATIHLGGIDLRNTLVPDLGSGCTSPAFGANSTTELLVLNCTVTTTGNLPITLKTANGELIYSGTLTVPQPQVMLLTAGGNITLELNPSAAPITVKNFLNYVNSGYYKDTLFHRVMAGFVVQGGGYTTGMVKKPGQAAAITLESNNGLSNLRGTVAMARQGDPNYKSATSEFYVNLVDNRFLDYKDANSPGYAVFGKVVQGLSIVDTIATQPTGTTNGNANVPLTDVTITQALQIQ